MKTTYIAVVGINYPTKDGEARIEPGEPVPADLLKQAPWLLEEGDVVPDEPVKEPE